MVQDKVAAEVQFTYAGLSQTRQEVVKAREAVGMAMKMAQVERRKFEVGQSDLLKVALREQYSLEAAEEEISATFSHFSAFADYAAMLAVNDPNVVLGAAETRFLRPVQVGDVIVARATRETTQGKKQLVKVSCTRAGDPADAPVMEGTFTCFVLPQHVLEGADS